ncbi:MAG: GTPase HflX [Candidatus Electryoneaceae bacterium]|nr:GTPase HflX [Candidatus Electryoneaceae bacterium]
MAIRILYRRTPSCIGTFTSLYNQPAVGIKRGATTTTGNTLLGKPLKTKERIENAIIVAVQQRGVSSWEVEDNLDELEQLLDTAGGETVARVVQNRHSPDPGTFIGAGKVKQLTDFVVAFGADLIVFDDDLTPAQVRNLENKLQCKVIDRSWLILDIFSQRAQSKEARIQVELAQLQYLLPRLTGRWGHLSRQVGGIGTRGPGETQLEVDRREISRRISHLREQLTKIEKARITRRHRRRDMFKVALIGYTNAGKSTLLNSLTKSSVFVEDRLFATLDPTVRALRLPSGKRVLLIDTVGFIRKLPVGLLASFRSTLEESRQADLFVNVVDLSHPHWEGQLARTEEILAELELDRIPQLLAFNKVDKVSDLSLLDGLRNQYPEALFISALRGIRLYEVTDRITRFAKRKWVRQSRAFRPDEADELKLFEAEKDIRVIGRSFRDGLIYIDFLIPDTTVD